MTFKDFKHLTQALLIGDVALTENNNEIIVLLRYAYERIANEADALKLFTINSPDEKIIRNGPGNIFVRYPKIPEYEEDELDIDEELCFAASRYVCSFVSSTKTDLHIREASRIINSYNQKVQTFLENTQEDSFEYETELETEGFSEEIYK